MYKSFIKYTSIFLLLAALLAGGCRSRKAQVSEQAYTPSAETQTETSTQAPARAADRNIPADRSCFEALAATYGDWQSVSMPVKVQITSPKRISVSGTAKMVNGKALTISLRMLGLVDVATIYADADSVLLVSRAASLYVCEPMAALTKYTGLTLSDLQAALLGRAFRAGKGQIAAADYGAFAVSPSAEGGYLMTPASTGAVLTGFGIETPDNGAPYVSAFAAETAVATAMMSMGMPQNTEVGAVAPSLTVEASAGKISLLANVTWSLDRAQWNSPQSLARPSIPRNARRVGMTQLVNMLKKL